MKLFRALTVAVLLFILLFSVPAQAIPQASPLALISDDVYIHFFGGAALGSWLEKHKVSERDAILLMVAAALAKEAYDTSLRGGRFDLAEAGLSVAGTVISYRF